MPLSPTVPRSLTTFTRAEGPALTLDVLEGSLPSDLRGHVFLVAPVGTVDCEADPTRRRRTTWMTGDGMVLRFDLDAGGVSVVRSLARTRDLIADQLTHQRSDLALLRFHSSGLARLSPLLGSRCFANTAFVPVPGSAGEPTRMLLTYDASRPVWLDPGSLAVRGPLGAREDWRAEVLGPLAFPLFLSPAHPSWDARTGELFTVDYGRGALNFAATIPLVHTLASVPEWLALIASRAATALGRGPELRHLLKHLERWTTRLDRRYARCRDHVLPEELSTFTELLRFDAEGRGEAFRLELPDGRPVAIQQSVHQIAVTRSHVVILETGFKVGFQSGFSDPLPEDDLLERTLRAVLTRPQMPETIFYVVERAELEQPNLLRDEAGRRRVRAQRIALPLEADHFLADYDELDGQLSLHVAHAPATDLSEWVRPYDVSLYGGQPIDEELHGMLAVGAMDVGRFGHYLIDPARGCVTQSETLADDRLSWAIALYAGEGLNTDAPLPERLDSIFWCTEGYFPELATEFVYDLYENYPHRLTPLRELRALAREGRPSAILRVGANPLSIRDHLELPAGSMAGSMQWMPGGDSGYLFATVFTPSSTEVWVIDAADLSRVHCRLGHPDLRLGFSLHSAWLPEVSAEASPLHPPSQREDVVRELDGPGLEPEARRFVRGDLADAITRAESR